MNPGHTGGNHSPSNSEQQHQQQQQQQQQQDGPAIVSDEILARRIKNRERQRRYRARKRLELDMRKSCLSGQHATLQTDAHFNLNPPPPPPPHPPPPQLSSFPEARSYSGGRNWKKDAREAGSSFASGTRARRNWKADARNKAGEPS